jgi:Na+-driven multidrug efflux pump
MVSICNALGMAMRALIVATLRLFACFLPFIWIGSELGGINGLMTGALIGNLLAGGMAYLFYRRGIRQLVLEEA